MHRLEPAEWLAAFLRGRRLLKPDGRPLWAYRTTAEELEQLKFLLEDLLDQRRLAQATGGQLFTLFAAEHWRRHYDGHGWKWEVVLEPLGIRGPYQEFYETVERGLGKWHRRLLHDSTGRLFLASLAVEGGLPLHLVTKEGSSLRRFFRRLLEEYRRFHLAGYPVAELAAEAGAETLPTSLRQAAIYRLGGMLVEEIWQLQTRVGDAEDPVSALDASKPDWREGMPLEIRDETARALLNNLVREASELARHRPPRLRLNRRLRCRGEGFELEAQMEIPAQMERRALAELLGRGDDEVPSRAEILLQRPDGSRSLVAVMSEVYAAGGGTLLRVERHPSKRGGRFRGGEGLGRFSLWIGEGTASHGPVEFAGCRLTSELPWAFVREHESDDEAWRFVGEGSLASRRSSLAVFVPPDWQLVVEEGQAEALGEIEAVAGTVYEVTGRSRIQGPDVREVTIRTGQAVDSAVEYRLIGPTEPSGVGEVFRGAPRVVAFDDEGRQLRAPVDVEWRPVGSGKAWRPLSPECLGRVLLRVEEEGSLRFLERIDVVPAGFELGLKPGIDRRRGKILLEGLEGARVGLEEAAGVRCEVVARDESTFFMEVQADGDAPPMLTIYLAWDEERRLTLPVPFPARGAYFVGRDGRALEIEEQTTVDRLSGIRATATTLDEAERFMLTARLLADDVPDDLELDEPIPRLGRGRFEVDLGLVQEPLRRMLSASRELGATVRLRVEADQGTLPPQLLQVARFEAPLSLDKNLGEAAVTESRSGEELRVEALPLWQPEETPVLLETTERAGTFRFTPARRQTGPWLLLGWDGDWCRFRPTLWTVGVEGETVREEALTPLQRVIRLGDRERRRSALAAEVERLAEQADDPGWSQVEGSIERQHLLPAGTFELLRELVGHPTAAVGALARTSDRDRLVRTWNVLEQLPFAWRLVPLRAWVEAVDRLRRARLEKLANLPGMEELVDEQLRSFLEIVEAHRPFLKVVSGWLRIRVLGDSVDPELGASAAMLEGLLQAERQLLLTRAADRWWPRGHRVDDWFAIEPELPELLRRQLRAIGAVSVFKRPVLSAPLVAAFASVLDLSTRPSFLFDLRRLRAFDTRYFDATYENGLRLALSVLLDEDPEILR